MYTKAEITHTF